MIPSFLLQKDSIPDKVLAQSKKLTFIDKTINSAALVVSSTFLHWQSAKKSGLFQQLDSRIKVLFLLVFVVFISVTVAINDQIILACILLMLGIVSKLNLIHLYKRILSVGFIFGFLIFIPAALNLFSKGENAYTLIRFDHPHRWWIYTVPQEISLTREGLQMVARLTLKVINSVTVVMLVISTTSFERIVKSLSFFRIPDIFLLTLTLSYRFIFILSNTTVETYYAIKMRWWNRGRVKDAEDIVAGRIGYLFRKSWERYELTYQSMLARGFTGKVNFCYFNKFKPVDYLFIVATLLFFSLFILINYLHA